MAACVQCGNRSAPAARWCNQCGTPLPDVSLAAPPRHAADPQAPYDRPALLDTSSSSENPDSTALSMPATSMSTPPAPGAVALAADPQPEATPPPPPPGPVPPPPHTPPQTSAPARNTRSKDGPEHDGHRLRVLLIAAVAVFLIVAIVAL